MIILSHRGFWREPGEKNTLAAFRYSVAQGFGTETDFRDCAGQLVISHDPPTPDALGAREVAELFAGTSLPLAVNIKADGISEMIAALFDEFDIPWFAFDMSGPESLRYARAGLPFFTRHSDIEPEPLLYDQAAGVWLDAFEKEWFDADVIDTHLDAGKRVCIVSPDLHGREPGPLWDMLYELRGREELMLCTDIPHLALERFGS